MKRLLLFFGMLAVSAQAIENRLAVEGETILQNGTPVKLLGLRCSNALMSDRATADLVAMLDVYQEYGLNAVSVFVMGSRFGNVKGYLPDARMDPVIAGRLERVLKETKQRGMIVIVGCLYWGTSEAKADLSMWSKADAERAVACTAGWLKAKGFTHVILDPDNEGMAVRENKNRKIKWRAEDFIRAAKAANPNLLVANNTRQKTESEDLNMHFGPLKEGKPWLNSESTPEKTPLGAYWSRFSRENHDKDPSFFNYSRIGRYTEEMKRWQFEETRKLMEYHSGILFAGTWLQCSPAEGIGGPFPQPGGYANMGSQADTSAAWNQAVEKLHPDAGIRWWLDFVGKMYGSDPARK